MPVTRTTCGGTKEVGRCSALRCGLRDRSDCVLVARVGLRGKAWRGAGTNLRDAVCPFSGVLAGDVRTRKEIAEGYVLAVESRGGLAVNVRRQAFQQRSEDAGGGRLVCHPEVAAGVHSKGTESSIGRLKALDVLEIGSRRGEETFDAHVVDVVRGERERAHGFNLHAEGSRVEVRGCAPEVIRRAEGNSSRSRKGLRRSNGYAALYELRCKGASGRAHRAEGHDQSKNRLSHRERELRYGQRARIAPRGRREKCRAESVVRVGPSCGSCCRSGVSD
jgi:hypothetical protein